MSMSDIDTTPAHIITNFLKFITHLCVGAKGYTIESPYDIFESVT